jgi:hypothetical protein
VKAVVHSSADQRAFSGCVRSVQRASAGGLLVDGAPIRSSAGSQRSQVVGTPRGSGETLPRCRRRPVQGRAGHMQRRAASGCVVVLAKARQRRVGRPAFDPARPCTVRWAHRSRSGRERQSRRRVVVRSGPPTCDPRGRRMPWPAVGRTPGPPLLGADHRVRDVPRGGGRTPAWARDLPWSECLHEPRPDQRLVRAPDRRSAPGSTSSHPDQPLPPTRPRCCDRSTAQPWLGT